MKRREFLTATGAAALGLSTFPLGWARSSQHTNPKILYFTRCAGFIHPVVKRQGDELSYSEKILVAMGKEHGVDVVCSKDGRVFDGDLDQFDAIAFYTSGDLTREGSEKTPPMTPDGKKRLLDTIAEGKGFVGFHSATDSFHSQGSRNENQTEVDPYIAMIGGEFVSHGPQQVATMRVTSPEFPGAQGLGQSFELLEEWYALKNFAKDLHVILVQETEGMNGGCYQRPPFPSTWARMHGKGRVFYTALGHREDVFTNELCRQLVIGGFSWVMGDADADITPNIDKVTPEAHVLPTS